MYMIYTKETAADGAFHYKLVEKGVHLFGCNVGYIPMMLRKIIPPAQNSPYFWHLCVGDLLPEIGKPGHALVINLQPNDEKKLSLFELMDVWGHSENGWTPIMFHLQGLFVEQDPKTYSQQEFSRKSSEIDRPIFTMMHFHESYVKDGQLVGPWTPPRPGPTNSVLLWPETFQFFMSAARDVINRQSSS